MQSCNKAIVFCSNYIESSLFLQICLLSDYRHTKKHVNSFKKILIVIISLHLLRRFFIFYLLQQVSLINQPNQQYLLQAFFLFRFNAPFINICLPIEYSLNKIERITCKPYLRRNSSSVKTEKSPIKIIFPRFFALLKKRTLTKASNCKKITFLKTAC